MAPLLLKHSGMEQVCRENQQRTLPHEAGKQQQVLLLKIGTLTPAIIQRENTIKLNDETNLRGSERFVGSQQSWKMNGAGFCVATLPDLML